MHNDADYDPLYESLQSVRDQNKILEQLCLIQYERAYACSGCGEPILDNKHMFTAPDGKRYHDRDCASIDEPLLSKEEDNPHGNIN